MLGKNFSPTKPSQIAKSEVPFAQWPNRLIYQFSTTDGLLSTLQHDSTKLHTGWLNPFELCTDKISKVLFGLFIAPDKLNHLLDLVHYFLRNCHKHILK